MSQLPTRLLSASDTDTTYYQHRRKARFNMVAAHNYMQIWNES